jgi:hypothetical protein
MNKKEKYEEIKTDLEGLLEGRRTGKIPLALAKEKYNGLLVDLKNFSLEDNKSISSLEDLIINEQTTFQDFELKLESLINVIEYQFLVNMANFTNN